MKKDIRKKNTIIKRLTSRRFLRIVQALASILLIVSIYRLGMLPMKYFIVFAIIIFALYALPFWMIRKRKSRNEGMTRILLGKCLCIVLSISLLIINVMVYKGNSFLNGLSSNFETHVVSVIVLKNSKFEKVGELKDENFGIMANGEASIVVNAIEDISKEVDNEISTEPYDSALDLASALYNKKVKAIILNESNRYIITQQDKDFNSKTKVVYKSEIKEKIDSSDTDITKEVTTVLISGADVFDGEVEEVKHSDVNILVTVNPKTKQVLLTSIPRDTYVELATYKEKDKLTHASVYGLNESIKTLENFVDCDIDYYFRINFTSLIKIVDALGGVTIDNPIAFTSSLDSSSGVGEYDFPEGEITLNGTMSLIYSRERQVFADGDNMRGRNQQRILSALIKKACSPSVITRYSKILNSLSGAFETDLNDKQIRSFIQMQLSDMATWDIQSIQLEVSESQTTESYSMKGFEIYVSEPKKESLAKIKKYIKNMEAGKKINTQEQEADETQEQAEE